MYFCRHKNRSIQIQKHSLVQSHLKHLIKTGVLELFLNGASVGSISQAFTVIIFGIIDDKEQKILVQVCMLFMLGLMKIGQLLSRILTSIVRDRREQMHARARTHTAH